MNDTKSLQAIHYWYVTTIIPRPQYSVTTLTWSSDGRGGADKDFHVLGEFDLLTDALACARACPNTRLTIERYTGPRDPERETLDEYFARARRNRLYDGWGDKLPPELYSQAEVELHEAGACGRDPGACGVCWENVNYQVATSKQAES